MKICLEKNLYYGYNKFEVFQTSAVLLEGGITAISKLILFEKYNVTDIVYESDTVTIYLVEHIYMSTMRIIKRILKNSVCRDAFYSEVNILKDIKHPNIPTIYDVEEDSVAYYIIEDYIEGDNLDTVVRKRGFISEREAVDIGIKLCHIVSFLHNQKPRPILFLDIHPKNIIINDEKIYLVDFGSSYHLDETENRKIMMGTVGYAAPEQYKRGNLDERTDVYGIGAVLYFLVTGTSCDKDMVHSLIFPHEISENLKIVILQCLAYDRNDRIRSVEVLEDCLSTKYNEDNICTHNEKSRTISFAGVDRRVGVTHICLAFAAYLSGQGYKVLYEEANTSNHIRYIAAGEKMKYHNGFFCAGELRCKPRYGTQISLESNCQYILRDCGVFDEQILYDSDEVVLVAGAKHWELEKAAKVCKEAISKKNSKEKVVRLHVICNGSHDNEALRLWNRTGIMGKTVPFLHELLEHKKYNDREKQFFEELKSMIGIGKKGGEIHRKRAWIFRKATEKTR